MCSAKSNVCFVPDSGHCVHGSHQKKNPGKLPGASLFEGIEPHQHLAAAASLVLVFHTFALFKMPLFCIVNLIEHFVPRLIQGSLL